MKLTTKLGAACALALGAVGAVSALGGHANAAQTPTAPPSVNAGLTNTAPPADTPAVLPSAQAPAPDTDNVQSGDQSTPDASGAVPASEAPDTSEAGPTPESSGVPSDGPGGHQDNGNSVDHQFVGSE